MFAGFFEKLNPKDDELIKSFEIMSNQIKEVGGSLTFIVNTDEEGWSAECKEFPGIITGGVNKNPTDMEVMNSVIDAVKTAFNVPITKLEAIHKLVPEKVKQSLEIPTIKLEREFQLA